MNIDGDSRASFLVRLSIRHGHLCVKKECLFLFGEYENKLMKFVTCFKEREREKATRMKRTTANSYRVSVRARSDSCVQYVCCYISALYAQTVHMAERPEYACV